jgi:hypothetical protein
MKAYVTSVVLGNDLVCRLSFRSLCRLRNDVLDAISRARVNKMMIMQALFKDFDAADLMYPPGQEPDTPFKRSISEFKELMRVRLEAQQIPLCLPGRIIHLAKSSKSKRCPRFVRVAGLLMAFMLTIHCTTITAKACCRSETKYVLREAETEEFEEILMSTTMGSDHFPDVYYYEIRKVLNERLGHMTV